MNLRDVGFRGTFYVSPDTVIVSTYYRYDPRLHAIANTPACSESVTIREKNCLRCAPIGTVIDTDASAMQHITLLV